MLLSLIQCYHIILHSLYTQIHIHMLNIPFYNFPNHQTNIPGYNLNLNNCHYHNYIQLYCKLNHTLHYLAIRHHILRNNDSLDDCTQNCCIRHNTCSNQLRNLYDTSFPHHRNLLQCKRHDLNNIFHCNIKNCRYHQRHPLYCILIDTNSLH